AADCEFRARSRTAAPSRALRLRSHLNLGRDTMNTLHRMRNLHRFKMRQKGFGLSGQEDDALVHRRDLDVTRRYPAVGFECPLDILLDRVVRTIDALSRGR